MDCQHKSVLKYIYKHQYVSYKELESHFSELNNFKEIFNYLANNKFISLRTASNSKDDKGYECLYLEDSAHLVPTMLGNEIIENDHRQNIQWIITTAIAVFAAIGAYREELALVIQAILP